MCPSNQAMELHMSNQTLFPFHPVTGNRLTATLDFVPGIAHREISKTNGELGLGDASETAMDWNGAEEQKLHGASFLTNENADECLIHEVLWREEDVDSIVIEEPGIATTTHSPNTQRDRLAELGSAAREVVLRSDDGQSIQDIGEAVATLKALLDAMGLMDPDDEDE